MVATEEGFAVVAVVAGGGDRCQQAPLEALGFFGGSCTNIDLVGAIDQALAGGAGVTAGRGGFDGGEVGTAFAGDIATCAIICNTIAIVVSAVALFANAQTAGSITAAHRDALDTPRHQAIGTASHRANTAFNPPLDVAAAIDLAWVFFGEEKEGIEAGNARCNVGFDRGIRKGSASIADLVLPIAREFSDECRRIACLTAPTQTHTTKFAPIFKELVGACGGWNDQICAKNRLRRLARIRASNGLLSPATGACCKERDTQSKHHHDTQK